MSQAGAGQTGAAQHERHSAKVIGVTVAAAVGGFLFGFDSSVVNGAVDAIQGDFALSDIVVGFAVAVALLGCAVGAWFAGQLADQIGRKKVMMIGAVLFVSSSIGAGLATNVELLIVWRIVGSLGRADVVAKRLAEFEHVDEVIVDVPVDDAERVREVYG